MNSRELMTNLLIDAMILRDGLKIERELEIIKAKRLILDLPMYCYRCSSQPCKCGLLIGHEPTVLKPGEGNAYPDGRARSLQP